MLGDFMWQRFCFTGNIEDYLIYKEAERGENDFTAEGATDVQLMPI